MAARRAHPESRLLAGGTDLIANLRRELGSPETLVDIPACPDLQEIAEGRRRPHRRGRDAGGLAENPLIRPVSGAGRGRRAIAGPGHRASATIGGNLCLDTRCIFYNQSEWWRRANDFCLKYRGEVCHVAPQGKRCHAAYSGDTAPVLLVLQAQVEIGGATAPGGLRSTIYSEDGEAHLRLGGDEMVLAVRVPPDPLPSAYDKARPRRHRLSARRRRRGARDRNGAVNALRIAITGTNSRPFLLAGTDELLGRPIDEKMLQQVDRLVQKQVQPMRTTVASAHYRRLAAAGLARRLVSALAAASTSRS